MIYLGSYGRGIWMDTTYFAPVGIEPVYRYSTPGSMLRLSPNPVIDDLNVSFNNEASGSVDAFVYDLAGRVVLTKSYGNQPRGIFNGMLDLSGLPQGTYIVKVGNSFGKVVKL